MMLLEPDADVIMVTVNKRTHKVEIENETESSLSVIITPLDQRPQTDKED